MPSADRCRLAVLSPCLVAFPRVFLKFCLSPGSLVPSAGGCLLAVSSPGSTHFLKALGFASISVNGCPLPTAAVWRCWAPVFQRLLKLFSGFAITFPKSLLSHLRQGWCVFLFCRYCTWHAPSLHTQVSVCDTPPCRLMPQRHYGTCPAHLLQRGPNGAMRCPSLGRFGTGCGPGPLLSAGDLKKKRILRRRDRYALKFGFFRFFPTFVWKAIQIRLQRWDDAWVYQELHRGLLLIFLTKSVWNQ